MVLANCIKNNLGWKGRYLHATKGCSLEKIQIDCTIPETGNPMSNESDFVAAKPTLVASYLDVQVPSSPFLTEGRIERINTGKYEGQEIEGVLALVTPEDRVLELGAGIGVVGAIIAKTAQPAAMM